MFDVSIGGAFVAGLVSFFTPCVLPIVPSYLAYIAGVSFSSLQGQVEGESDRLDTDTRRNTSRAVFLSALLFVLGFSTVFVILGATASALGQALARYYDSMMMVAGVLIILLGLHFTGLVRIPLMYREARLDIEKPKLPLVGAYVVGLAFAFGWTPCVGPVLAAILFVAGSEQVPQKGALLLLAYSIGMGLPFLLAAAFFARFLAFSKRIRRHLGTMEKIVGALLIVTGLLFLTGQISRIAEWMLRAFPQFINVG